MESGNWYTEEPQVDETLKSLFHRDADDIHLLEIILIIAGRSNGRVFGGYVRDVIVPRLKDPECEIKFKDVDIWFSKQDDMDIFVDETKGYSEQHRDFTFVRNDNYEQINESMGYSFERIQYCLYKDTKFVSHFDLVISEKIFVDDFNVNCLTYLCKEDEKIAESFNSSTVESLISSIHKKKVYMLPSYAERFISRKISVKHFTNRITTNFLKKGWKIFCFDNCVFPENIDEKWVSSTFIFTAKKYLTTRCNKVGSNIQRI
jgi:hypothetical protein